MKILFDFFLLYFVIGCVYVLINGIVRKIYTDYDDLLPTVHLFLWPLFFVIILINSLQKLRK